MTAHELDLLRQIIPATRAAPYHSHRREAALLKTLEAKGLIAWSDDAPAPGWLITPLGRRFASGSAETGDASRPTGGYPGLHDPPDRETAMTLELTAPPPEVPVPLEIPVEIPSTVPGEPPLEIPGENPPEVPGELPIEVPGTPVETSGLPVFHSR